jgi:hypothetical protein
MPITELLNSSHIPNTVYYVWCGRRWFEFHHYLSVRSVIRHLRPDNIVFLYNSLPTVDSWTYNTWYSELTDEYPFFRPQQLNDKTEPACLSEMHPNMTFISWLLSTTGGMYIHENTVLAEYPVELRFHDLVVATNTPIDGDLTNGNGGIGIPALLASKRGLDIVGWRAIKSRLEDRSLRTRRSHAPRSTAMSGPIGSRCVCRSPTSRDCFRETYGTAPTRSGSWHGRSSTARRQFCSRCRASTNSFRTWRTSSGSGVGRWTSCSTCASQVWCTWPKSMPSTFTETGRQKEAIGI